MREGGAPRRAGLNLAVATRGPLTVVQASQLLVILQVMKLTALLEEWMLNTVLTSCPMKPVSELALASQNRLTKNRSLIDRSIGFPWSPMSN